MIDRKGILSFLGITFVITYAVEGAMVLGGMRFDGIPPMFGQLVVAVAMWVPTVATLLTCWFITHEKLSVLNFRFGSWKPYFAAGLLIPLAFAIIYGLTWLFGLGQPDWELKQFLAMMTAASGKPLTLPASPIVMLGGIFVASLVFVPIFNGLVALGEEIGWRGYLLPKLMPLGKPAAYGILGIVWGLWHLPLLLVGFNYPGQPFWGTLAFVAMTTAFGIYMNEMALQNRSTILAGWMHGVFNSQRLGVWGLLFPSVDVLLGGFGGIIGIAVWLALGLWQWHRGSAQAQSRPLVPQLSGQA